MSQNSENKTSNSVTSVYKSRIHALQDQMDAIQIHKRWALAVALACALLAMALLAIGLEGRSNFILSIAIPLIGAVASVRSYVRSRAIERRLAHTAMFYEKGIDRTEGNWRGKGHSGAGFGRAGHLYETDLNILGEGSLFELLATTRTEVGAERLAVFLLDSTTMDEARARQAAVKELRKATALREEVALLGKYQFQNCEGKHLRDWLGMRAVAVPRIVPAFLLFSGTVSFALGVCGYAKIAPWTDVLPLLAPFLLAQLSIGLWLMARARLHLKVLLGMGADVAVLRQGVALLARQPFQCAKLRELVERVRGGDAEKCIRRLERLVMAVERREDLFLYGFSLWLAAGTQLVLATERWRAKYGKGFEGWLDAWAEFEALNALGGYAHEHSEDEFPELVDGEGRFEASALRHPLLVCEQCVGNDVTLNGSTAFYVISGSNMAGKSTFLRAMGLNAVLASAGAPVAATGARMSVFEICASISILDSLDEGKSKFLAEVERLRASIDAARGSRPVLFLLDEILSGTNSRDRRVAAQAVIEALRAGGAVGAFSTHDLALTEIAEAPSLCGVNVHMQSDDPEQPLAFDYRLKPGVLRQANALAIVKMMGIST